jgi:hypothetical protein
MLHNKLKPIFMSKQIQQRDLFISTSKQKVGNGSIYRLRITEDGKHKYFYTVSIAWLYIKAFDYATKHGVYIDFDDTHLLRMFRIMNRLDMDMDGNDYEMPVNKKPCTGA